jgi:hypothetical protein
VLKILGLPLKDIGRVLRQAMPLPETLRRQQQVLTEKGDAGSAAAARPPADRCYPPVMRIAAAVAAAALSVLPAQQARGQTAVGVAAGASRQEPGANDLPYLGPPFGGTAAALIGMVDHRIGSVITIGGEASLAGAISGDQSQRASPSTRAFTSSHRDSVFSGVFKIGTPLERRLHGAFALGGGLGYRRTAREGTTAPLVPPSTRSPYSEVISDLVFAYSLGGDVDVRISERIRILVVARWHLLHDDDLQDDGVVKRGVSSTVFRAGAGISWRF